MYMYIFSLKVDLFDYKLQKEKRTKNRLVECVHVQINKIWKKGEYSFIHYSDLTTRYMCTNTVYYCRGVVIK